MGDTFHGVIAFAFMVALVLVGAMLRVRFAVIQTMLVPASLLGGLLGFILINTNLAFGLESSDFVAFAFHFFTLSFMSLVLTGREEANSDHSIQRGGWWLTLGWTMSLVLQALVGLLVIVVFNQLSGGELSYYLGMLVTHGFTQGPGQAMAMGSIWETNFNVDQAVSFGLIYASMGFVISFLVGVPAARYAIRKGLNENTAARLTESFLTGFHDPAARPEAGRQVTHSANVDSLVFHLGILGVAYLITNEYLLAMQTLTADAKLGELALGVLFTHNLFFIHGLLVCMILRALIDRFGFGDYIDNETQKHITGSSVDLMMIATVLGIQFTVLSAYFVPILGVCIAVASATALLCFLFGRLLNHLPAERAITLFGCCTGSTGSGLLLLRILDPDLSTPVARELAFFNVAIIFTTLHVLAFMAPLLPSFELLTVLGVYGLTFAVGGAILWWLSPRT